MATAFRRRRENTAAAPAPNSRIIEGSGTCVPEVVLPLVLVLELDELLLDEDELELDEDDELLELEPLVELEVLVVMLPEVEVVVMPELEELDEPELDDEELDELDPLLELEPLDPLEPELPDEPLDPDDPLDPELPLLVWPQWYLHGGLPPVDPPLLPELDDEDELDEEDELELDEDDELLDPPVLLVVVLVIVPLELVLVIVPLELEVDPPLDEVELPVVVLLLSILISTLPPPELLLPPKKPPKKPPPKPPPNPLEPPITIGWPPPVAMIGCCGICGSGIGTIAYCCSSQHWRSTTRRTVRSRRGTVRSGRRCLTYRGRSFFTILSER